MIELTDAVEIEKRRMELDDASMLQRIDGDQERGFKEVGQGV